MALVTPTITVERVGPYGARTARTAGAIAVAAGLLLTARKVWPALFKGSPVDLKYSAGLDPAIARHLQTVTWETVQEYFRL